MAGCAGTTEGSAPQAEGIVVHGDWKLDVYDADGTFDRTIEFHNEVVGAGLNHIVSLLAGTHRNVGWDIALGVDAGENNLPCLNNGSPVKCAAEASASSVSNRLSLEASIVVDRDGEIGTVQSLYAYDACQPAASTCPEGNRLGGIFSNKSIRDGDGAQYVVTAGQSVQVSVEFTFTSG